MAGPSAGKDWRTQMLHMLMHAQAVIDSRAEARCVFKVELVGFLLPNLIELRRDDLGEHYPCL